VRGIGVGGLPSGFQLAETRRKILYERTRSHERIGRMHCVALEDLARRVARLEDEILRLTRERAGA
jgi:hypothetical protein